MDKYKLIQCFPIDCDTKNIENKRVRHIHRSKRCDSCDHYLNASYSCSDSDCSFEED